MNFSLNFVIDLLIYLLKLIQSDIYQLSLQLSKIFSDTIIVTKINIFGVYLVL